MSGQPGQLLMYGKEAGNRKQETDRQHHTIPNQSNQRPKDSKLCTLRTVPTTTESLSSFYIT